MKDRLVTTCVDILKILPSTGLGVNKIIGLTSKGAKNSPDRSHVIEAIKTLEKGKMASHERWSLGKPKIIKPTALGDEIKDLMNQIDLFRNTFKNFENVVYQRFLSKKRSQEDIKISINLDVGHFLVKSLCEKDILLALVHRFSLIHFKYELNQISDAILINIVSNEFKYQLFEKGKQVLENENQNTKIFNEIHRSLMLRSVMQPIIKDIHHVFTKDFHISSWKTGRQQLKELLSSLLTVAKISSDSATRAITFAEYDDSDKLKMSDNKTYDEDYLEHLEYVSEVLQEFRPHGYHNLPNSEEYRKRDREELISIYKNFT